VRFFQAFCFQQVCDKEGQVLVMHFEQFDHTLLFHIKGNPSKLNTFLLKDGAIFLT
jgi:hypothetical protein